MVENKNARTVKYTIEVHSFVRLNRDRGTKLEQKYRTL